MQAKQMLVAVSWRLQSTSDQNQKPVWVMGSSSIKFQAASEFDMPNNWLKIGGGGGGGGGSDAAEVRLNLVSLVMTWWLNVHFLPYLQLPLKKFLQIGTESVA